MLHLRLSAASSDQVRRPTAETMLNPCSAMRHPALTLCLVAASTLLLAGCDALGIETAAQENEKKEAEGRAIGSACRHAVRSIEDCFRSNPKASKAAVFAGWKDMDAYMRENEIVGMPFTPPPPTPPADAEATAEDGGGNGPAAGKGHGEAEADPAAKKTHKS
jgi:hypothetical protein